MTSFNYTVDENTEIEVNYTVEGNNCLIDEIFFFFNDTYRMEVPPKWKNDNLEKLRECAMINEGWDLNKRDTDYRKAKSRGEF